jgi:hypothetical protein
MEKKRPAIIPQCLTLRSYQAVLIFIDCNPVRLPKQKNLFYLNSRGFNHLGYTKKEPYQNCDKALLLHIACSLNKEHSL